MSDLDAMGKRQTSFQSHGNDVEFGSEAPNQMISFRILHHTYHILQIGCEMSLYPEHCGLEILIVREGLWFCWDTHRELCYHV